MIPYFAYHSLPLGPVDIQVWGLFVSAGLAAALLVARHELHRSRLPLGTLYDLAAYLLLPAIVMSRVLYILLYDFAAAADPWSWLELWRGGMSSFGGYVGAALGLWAFRRRHRVDLGPYVEALAYAFPLGYGIGRLGCFFIHDHPGIMSASWLAVAYPGGPRLDLGLLLSVFGFALFGAFAVLKRRGVGLSVRRIFLPLLLVSYGAARFGLDFLRAWDGPVVDQRFLLLTPAQYGAAVLVVIGLWLFRRRPVPVRPD
ncbi:MAG: prolipoprotein diacylglyceryl transferase family protein [bacterium]